MKTLEKVSDFVGKYMAAIVIVVAAGALFFPGPFSVVKTSWVNTLLGIEMFGTAAPEADVQVVATAAACIANVLRNNIRYHNMEILDYVFN